VFDAWSLFRLVFDGWFQLPKSSDSVAPLELSFRDYRDQQSDPLQNTKNCSSDPQDYWFNRPDGTLQELAPG